MNNPRPGSPVQTSELLLYTSPSGAVRVGVLVRDETAWLTQRSLSELFGVGVPAIAKHLKNIFESGELEQSSVLSILATTATDGKVYSTQWYHLDAVVAAGPSHDRPDRLRRRRHRHRVVQVLGLRLRLRGRLAPGAAHAEGKTATG